MKQDQISVLSLPGQIGLLNGNLIKPLQSGANITITDAGTHVVIASTAQSSSTDWGNVPLPVKFKENNSIKYDFKTDKFTINVPTVQIWGALYTDYQYSQVVMKSLL